jgi:hypothetical protein
VAKSADLRSLARLILARDTGRGGGRDALSRRGLVVDADTRQQIGGVSPSRFPGGETPRRPTPPAYARTFAALERECPDHVGPDEWQRAIEDGYRFLGRWGEQAAALGWTTRDLFGLHTVPDAPRPSGYRRLSRYDETGLIWLLQGRPVVAITEATAAIKNPMGVTVYRKDNKPALGPTGDSLDDFK